MIVEHFSAARWSKEALREFLIQHYSYEELGKLAIWRSNARAEIIKTQSRRVNGQSPSIAITPNLSSIWNMSSFRPLNIIVEQHSEDEEEDNSKEIQIEDALKLYQRAVKLHAQGPASYEQAQEAYEALFRSEIFTLPESLSEERRLQIYGDVDSESDETKDVAIDATIPATTANVSSNALPQILYLSYKNYGEFRLDSLKAKLDILDHELRDSDRESSRSAASASLRQLAEAVEIDDADLELWRKISRLGEHLGSARLARYCLESVLESNVAGQDAPSLEEKLASNRLRSVVQYVTGQKLSDQSRESPLLSATLRHHVDPYPFLQELGSSEATYVVPTDRQPHRLDVQDQTWSAIGRSFVDAVSDQDEGGRGSAFSFTCSLELPPRINDENGPEPSSIEVLADKGTGAGSIVQGSLETIAIEDAASNALTIGENKTGLIEQHEVDKGVDKAVEMDDMVSLLEMPEGQLKADVERASTTRKRPDNEPEPEPGDGIRGRSKRLKARASLAEAGNGRAEKCEDVAKDHRPQLKVYMDADYTLNKHINGILTLCNHQESLLLDSEPSANESSHDEAMASVEGASSMPLTRLQAILENWDVAKSRHFLSGLPTSDPSKSYTLGTISENSAAQIDVSGFEHFPEDDSLQDFVQNIQQESPLSVGEIAFRWLRALLTGKSLRNERYLSRYDDMIWSTTLKDTVSEVVTIFDSHVFSVCVGALSRGDFLLQDFVQALFQLHIERYDQASSDASLDEFKACRRVALMRWASLAREFTNQSPLLKGEAGINVSARYLWSTIVSNCLLDSKSTDDSISYYRDVAALLRSAKSAINPNGLVLRLANNTTMPEISAMTAEVQVTKMITLDFFSGIFNDKHDDPFVLIENLEPLLMIAFESKLNENEHPNADKHKSANLEGNAAQHGSFVREIIRFINRSNITFMLYLWKKLRTAYASIPFPPMILLCDLRSLQLVVLTITGRTSGRGESSQEQNMFLASLNQVDELLCRMLANIDGNTDAFDCLTSEHLGELLQAFKTLIGITQLYSRWDDSVRVGQVPLPNLPTMTSNKQFLKVQEKFRDLIARTWTVYYYILREEILQNENMVSGVAEYMLTYIQLAHDALGLRTFCGSAGRAFLKMSKIEVMRLGDKLTWSLYLPQIIFDLHGLNISLDPRRVHEHCCESTDMDKATAISIIDMVMANARQMTPKELLKTEVKAAIDEMQNVIKIPKLSKETTTRNLNKKILTAYLKSSIYPIDLKRSLRGIGSVGTTPARTDGALVAEKGWFSLIGQVSLSKFRSQKRSSMGSTEDLDRALLFFKLELEFDADKWETWYRLGQTFDSMLDEKTMWTSEKLENNMDELVKLQRQIISCYRMAVALGAGCKTDESDKLADLFFDFGSRIYSSSREPFSMLAFETEQNGKPYNSVDRGMFTDQAFKPLTTYSAWKLASILVARSSIVKNTQWTIFYLLGKLYWKMYDCDEKVRGDAPRISCEMVLQALTRAIECVPQKKDSRHLEKDPILEPHYKLLSIVHKLVKSGEISVEHAYNTLQISPYARNKSFGVPGDWLDFVSEVLKALRVADKSNWHHRLVVKAAQLNFDKCASDDSAWLRARQELTQQIFTKTMTIQVWRPEHERPGRHFVYTGRYVNYFVNILTKLNDKESVESLARRIRKKSGDFVNHTDIWRDLALSYLLILRNRAALHSKLALDAGSGDVFFKSKNMEEFAPGSARLESWVQSDDSSTELLDLLRDALEFKKLNNNALKTSIVEETIIDLYAAIYQVHAEDLRLRENLEENRNRMRVDTILIEAPSEEIAIEIDNEKKHAGVSKEQQAPARRRPLSISHRELMRRADALTTKSSSLLTAKTTAKGSMSKIKESTQSSVTQEVSAGANLENGYKPDASTPMSPLSVHDSADDESELSDVEDERENAKRETDQNGNRLARAVQPSLFPYLRGPSTAELSDESELEGEQASVINAHGRISDADSMDENVDGNVAKEEGGNHLVNGQQEGGITMEANGVAR